MRPVRATRIERRTRPLGNRSHQRTHQGHPGDARRERRARCCRGLRDGRYSWRDPEVHAGWRSRSGPRPASIPPPRGRTAGPHAERPTAPVASRRPRPDAPAARAEPSWAGSGVLRWSGHDAARLPILLVTILAVPVAAHRGRGGLHRGTGEAARGRQASVAVRLARPRHGAPPLGHRCLRRARAATCPAGARWQPPSTRMRPTLLHVDLVDFDGCGQALRESVLREGVLVYER